MLICRPGRRNVRKINGQLRGIYSFVTGTRYNYAENWFDDTIKSIGRSEIILKVQRPDGQTEFLSLDAVKNETTSLGTWDSESYNDKHALFNNTLFFTNGDQTSLPYLYNNKMGVKQVVWKFVTEDTANNFWSNGDESKSVDNVCVYNRFLYASQKGTLNVFYIDATEIDPDNQGSWTGFWDIFKMPTQGVFALTADLQLGGEIIAIFPLSKPGETEIKAYIAFLTNKGELCVYSGTNPGDEDPKNWILAARAYLPVPLNNRCICQLECDTVIATEEGLISLNRILFGQTNQITDALEGRISGLFRDVLFKDNSFKSFFFLRYFATKRWLIFNVPTVIPCKIVDLPVGSELVARAVIVQALKSAKGYLPRGSVRADTSVTDIDPDIEAQIKIFYESYTMAFLADMDITWEFNDGYAFIRFWSTTEEETDRYITRFRYMISSTYTHKGKRVRSSPMNRDIVSDYTFHMLKSDITSPYGRGVKLVGPVHNLPRIEAPWSSSEPTPDVPVPTQEPIYDAGGNIVGYKDTTIPYQGPTTTAYGFQVFDLLTEEDRHTRLKDENGDDQKLILTDIKKSATSFGKGKQVSSATLFDCVYRNEPLSYPSVPLSLYEQAYYGDFGTNCCFEFGFYKLSTDSNYMPNSSSNTQIGTGRYLEINNIMTQFLSPHDALLQASSVTEDPTVSPPNPNKYGYVYNIGSDTIGHSMEMMVWLSQRNNDGEIWNRGGPFNSSEWTVNAGVFRFGYRYQLNFENRNGLVRIEVETSFSFKEDPFEYDTSKHYWANHWEWGLGDFHVTYKTRTKTTDEWTIAKEITSVPTGQEICGPTIRTTWIKSGGSWDKDRGLLSPSRNYPFDCAYVKTVGNFITSETEICPMGVIENLEIKSHIGGFFTWGGSGSLNINKNREYLDLGNSNNLIPLKEHESWMPIWNKYDCAAPYNNLESTNKADIKQAVTKAFPFLPTMIGGTRGLPSENALLKQLQDLGVVPLLNATNIVAPYQSDQYIFDSHYGTWSKYQGLNMTDGCEHNGEFYFVSPINSGADPTESHPDVTINNVAQQFWLSKFDDMLYGDQSVDSDNVIVPIECSFATGYTDLDIPSTKKFLMADILGTQSLFYCSEEDINSDKYQPFYLTYSLDFQEQEHIPFPYSGWVGVIPTKKARVLHEKIMKANPNYYKVEKYRIKNLLKLKEHIPYEQLSRAQKMKFKRLFLTSASDVVKIKMFFNAKNATRISLGANFNVDQPFAYVYGIDLYFIPGSISGD